MDMRKKKNDLLRAAFYWIPQGKSGPEKKWLDGVEEDLRVLGVANWKFMVQDIGGVIF